MSNSALLSAKKYAREKQFRWAAATFERIINQESRDSAEAAYCLGIMHHTGSGVPENVYEAASNMGTRWLFTASGLSITRVASFKKLMIRFARWDRQ
ncbi:MAG: hypothetical protein WBD71_06985 [Xanthobacteraceae bacterium]